ncbi:MAG: FAD-binding protein [Phycisphaerales bacterium]|nr:FAD-binding protein [Phycisphaerales bacterium]
MQLPVLESPVPAEAVAELARRIDGEVRFGDHVRMLYATDASPYQVEPLGVVQPRHHRDVVEIVRWCNAHGLSMLARGGGSSLAGQTVNRSVVIDCSVHMRDCRIDPEQKIAYVGPGVVLDDLRRAAAQYGLTFGPEVSTSAQATIGGMVANNSAGLHSLWWGMTGDHVEAMEVVLADGRVAHLGEGASAWDPIAGDLARDLRVLLHDEDREIRDRFPKVSRNNGGYRIDLLLDQFDESTRGTLDAVNLARLICGSEGTLALVTSIELRLVELPAARGLIVLGFDTVPQALGAMQRVLDTEPSAVELLDQDVLDAAEAHPSWAQTAAELPVPLSAPSPAVLYVDYFADHADMLAERATALREAVPEAKAMEAFTPESQDRFWSLRKIGLGLLANTGSDLQPVPGVEDCAVPVERLAVFQQTFDAMLERHGVRATWYAHASVGLLHVRPRLNLRELDQRETFRSITREALDLVELNGGTISGEHGDGRIRSALMHTLYGPRVIDAMRAVKQLFDPEGRLNPGVIVEAPDLLEALRIDCEGACDPPSGPTGYHWRDEGSFEQAAKGCNGQGHCRRDGAGAMCPSYRVTRDERHSTRGRGNALRLAVTGQVVDGPANEDVHETMSLCLGCKACRYECPSQVDVTKLKSELDAMRWRRRGGAPFRVRARAAVRHINKLGSTFHRIANAVIGFGPTRWAARRVLGIHPKRSLPRFGPGLQGWAKGRYYLSESPVVLLYPDCFTMWSEPQVGRSAVQLLEAFGYRVLIPNADCCGRTSCSAGLLERAAGQVSSSATTIREAMLKHNAIGVVTVEPTCTTAIEQEWRELRLGDADRMARQVSDVADSVEGFLLEHWDDHPYTPKFTPTTFPVMLHVHCHQKHRADVTERLLRRCGFTDVQRLDSGCCGMAGSFGYDRSTFDLSMQIADHSLGEAIRGRSGAILAASGTSCRHQLSDAFGVEAHHPVALVHGALKRTRR